MNTALVSSNQNIPMWEDNQRIDEIRKLFAPKLSENEFKFFVGLGKATGLNPFLREIWSVKYQDNVPAQVFIGRDGYRKAAQAHSDYEWHEPDSIYENDTFEKINGEIHHKYNLKNRGDLIGAYCLVKRKSSHRPVCIKVSLEEYSTDKSLWKTKPETMIKKVAEAQALRLCFQDLLGGTYGEEEIPKNNEDNNLRTIEGTTQTEKLNNILKESAIIDMNTGEVMNDPEEEGHHDIEINKDQIDEIYALMNEKDFSLERVDKAIEYILKKYKVDDIERLTAAQGRAFIKQLNNVRG